MSSNPQLQLRLKSDQPVKKQLAARQKNLVEASGMPAKKLAALYQTAFSESDLETIATKNCENLIGSVELPVGLAGPLPVRSGLFDETGQPVEVVVPLATTEGALVASVNRGAKLIRLSGAADVFSDKVGMTRAPVFSCPDGRVAQLFTIWLAEHQAEIKELIEATSQHLTVLGWQVWIRGRQVWVRFEADTDQAMGMNMITIGVRAMWAQLKEQYAQDELLQQIEMTSVSGNVCTDKKDSSINRILGRGYWVQAEVMVPKQLVEAELGVAPQVLTEAHVTKNLVGSNVAGSQSQNMHVANVAAAVFTATGQDLAHVVEAAQASTTVEVTATGDLYVAVTAPNINVGVVGGGTWLPAQRQARDCIRLDGQPVTAEHLAEVLVAGMLAGELSGLAALASGQLAGAHQKLGRDTKKSNQKPRSQRK